jgi:hypothetical protein
MRISFKCLLFYFIIFFILLNLYFFSQLYLQQEYLNLNTDNQYHQLFSNNITKNKNNEFLVLDWTGNQHIFKEQDTIQCKFIFG